MEALKSLKLATEHSKTEIEEKLKDLVQNESRLREINTKTYDALCEKRGTIKYKRFLLLYHTEIKKYM